MKTNRIIYSRIIIYFVALLSITLLMGCKTLLFKNIFGSVSKVENIEDYEGYWESDDGLIGQIKILKDSSTIVMGGMIWHKKKEKFVVNSSEATITKINDVMFFNQKKDKNFYEVTQVELRKSDFTDKVQLRIWKPDIDEFERLVTNNLLPGKITTKTNDDGKVETDSVIVDSLSEELLSELIENDNLFNYKNVQVLRRVMKPVDKPL